VISSTAEKAPVRLDQPAALATCRSGYSVIATSFPSPVRGLERFGAGLKMKGGNPLAFSGEIDSPQVVA